MTIEKKQECNISLGTKIIGKWHKEVYTIVKELGFGANGVVYLAESNQGPVALKISDNGYSITSEVNVLKQFAKVQGSPLGPCLLDVDDWVSPTGKVISFYVMEYLEGDNLLTFLKKRGNEWLGVFILQLLNDLEHLHTNGWVFGDLKPENLIITGPTPRIRCIDVGGTTLQGRSIKEFTEFFDRGYWGLGTRKAEPTYDLFAVAMIMYNAAYPRRFTRGQDGLIQLQQAMKTPTLERYYVILEKALTGKYLDASSMRMALALELSGGHQKKANLSSKENSKPQASTTSGQTRASQRVVQKKQAVSPTTKTTTPQGNPSTRANFKKKSRKSGIFETLLLVLLITLAYFIYVYDQLL